MNNLRNNLQNKLQNKLHIALALAGLLAGSSCFAVSDYSAGALKKTNLAPITFESALQQAIANSPDLRKAQLAGEIAAQDTVRARSVFLPRLDYAISDQRIKSYGSIPGLESLLLSGRKSVFSTNSGLTLGLNVYNGGGDLANVKIASEKQVDAGLQLQVRRATLAGQVLDQFHVLRQAELELRIAELQMSAKLALLKLVQGDFAEGRKAALAVSEADYEARYSELAKLTKERAWHAARRDLLALIGAEPDAPVASTMRSGAVDTPLDTSLDTPLATINYRQVLSKQGFDVAGTVSEVTITESRIRQANMEIRQAKSRYLPKVDFFARTEFAGLSESSLVSAFNKQTKNKTFIGFTMAWNLFDGFDTTASVKSATSRAAIAQEDYNLAVNEQQKRLNELTRPLADAQEEEQIERKKFELLEKKLEIGRVKLELGKLDSGGFQSAETELRLQKIELEKRAESIGYFQAKLLLKNDGQGVQGVQNEQGGK